MNLSAIVHNATLPFRQPLARNIVRFQLITAPGDCEAVSLCCWKRSEPYPKTLREEPLAVRAQDGLQTQWSGNVTFPEETHYIKYYFRIRDRTGATKFFCEHGFSDVVPTSGYFELLQVNETDILTLPAWSRGIVYYQIFPERFAIGNPQKSYHNYVAWNALPTRENFFGGDLRGICTKLPYLQTLGVQCLYLNPIFLGDFNHKYATTDYFQIDPDFGSQNDLITLVDAAHQVGIRVLLDGVFNHVGTKFDPFEDLHRNGVDSPYHDWFYPKQYPIIVDATRYECVGDYPYMPRLRTANPAVRDYILRVMLHWLHVAKIDGWRLDVADELDTQTLRYLREHVKADYPDALLLGETWGDASRLVAENDQLDCAMNYLFRDAMIDFFAKHTIDASTLDARLQHMLMKYPDEVNLCMYNCLSSHDTARFLTEARNRPNMLKLAIAFQMLFPGSPAIYYGDELGMVGENDPGCRGGMVWEHPTQSLLSWSTDMIALRANSKAACWGKYHTLQVSISSDIFAFERKYNGERLIAIFNRGPIPHTLDFADTAETITVSPESVKIIQL